MACGEKSNEVLNEIYAADTSPNRIVQRIIKDFLAFRAEILPWTRVSEQAYLNAGDCRSSSSSRPEAARDGQSCGSGGGCDRPSGNRPLKSSR